MSENNEGGLADRDAGRTGGLSGSGQTGSNSNQQGRNFNSAYGRSRSQNATGRPYGELLPGARAPVVPGFGFAPRRDQTLGDIQQQNAIGNANYNQQNQNNNNGSGVQPQTTTRRVQRRNPRTGVLETVTVQVPVKPTPKPSVPVTFDPLSGIQVPPNPAYMDYQGYGTWPKHPISDYGFQTHFGNALTGGNIPSPPHTDPHGWPGAGWPGTRNEAAPAEHVGGDWSGGNNFGGQRAFGGPVQPGMNYTVGERGPETLQMSPGGGGQVIPHNPMDRAMGGGYQPGQPPMGQPTPPPAPPPAQPPMGGGFGQNSMQAFHQMLQQRQQSRPNRPFRVGSHNLALRGFEA